MLNLSIFEPTGSVYSILILVLGGLGLFLYGIELMSESLKAVSGNRLKILIEKATNNTFLGIITGVFVTVLIQSSSATTVIVIGLISAGLMSLKQSIGVMMGANIGTTVTAFLIGLDISKFSFIFVAIGVILILFIGSKKTKSIGAIIFGFGLIFVGLELMSLGLKPISEKEWFSSLMASMSNHPILGVLIGTGLTALVQSSSASIGILQQLFFDGAINLNAALAILLGCNIGTTITALLASISASRESKQASLFHVLFNVFGSLVFLLLFTPYTKLFTIFENTIFGPSNKLTIAFAHIFFNALTTIVIFLFINKIIKLIELIIPVDKSAHQKLIDRLNPELIISSPVLALENAKVTILEMGAVALQMLEVAKNYQTENNINFFEEIAELENKIDFYDHKIHDFLMEIQSANLSAKDKQNQIILLDTIRDFERIADHCVNLSEFYKNRYELNCELTGLLAENLTHYFELIYIQVHNAYGSFKTNDKKIARKIIELEREIDLLEKQYRRSQLLNKNEDSSGCNDIHYVDILANLERISDHCSNIAENILDPYYMNKERVNPYKNI